MTRREVQEYVAELVAISEHQTGATGRPIASETASTPDGVVVDLDAYRKGRTR